MHNHTSETQYIYPQLNYVDLFIAVPFVIIILLTLFCYTLLKDRFKIKKIHPYSPHPLPI